MRSRSLLQTTTTCLTSVDIFAREQVSRGPSYYEQRAFCITDVKWRVSLPIMKVRPSDRVQQEPMFRDLREDCVDHTETSGESRVTRKLLEHGARLAHRPEVGQLELVDLACGFVLHLVQLVRTVKCYKSSTLCPASTAASTDGALRVPKMTQGCTSIDLLVSGGTTLTIGGSPVC